MRRMRACKQILTKQTPLFCMWQLPNLRFDIYGSCDINIYSSQAYVFAFMGAVVEISIDPNFGFLYLWELLWESL